MGTQELKLPESYCYSNHRYFHRRLLSKASRFSESEHPFLARSKISHILAGLDPPGCRSVGARIYRNVALQAPTQPESGEWPRESVNNRILKTGARDGGDYVCDE